MYFVLFVFGLGASGQSVSFAVVTDNNPSHLVGTASGFNNLSVLVGAAIFQPLVGTLLHYSAQYRIVNHVPVYALSAYQKALLVMPCCYFVSLFIALFLLRESHPSRSFSIEKSGVII